MDIFRGTVEWPTLEICDYFAFCDRDDIRAEILTHEGIPTTFLFNKEYPIHLYIKWKFPTVFPFGFYSWWWRYNIWAAVSLTVDGGTFNPTPEWVAQGFYDPVKDEVLCPGLLYPQGQEGEGWFDTTIDPAIMGLPLGFHQYHINLEVWGYFETGVPGIVHGGLTAPRRSFPATVIVGKPTVDFTFSPNNQPAPSPVYFINTSINPLPGDPLTCLWDFGDGVISPQCTGEGGSPLLHIFQDPGEYPVTLKVTNSAGEDTITKTVTVGVGGPIPVFDRGECGILPDYALIGEEEFKPYFYIDNQGGPGYIWITARVLGEPSGIKSIFNAQYLEEGINTFEGPWHDISWYLGQFPSNSRSINIVFETNYIGLPEPHSSWTPELWWAPNGNGPPPPPPDKKYWPIIAGGAILLGTGGILLLKK